MNQECRAAVDVGAQQAQAFVGGIPALDDNVVQFVAQKIFDYAFVARIDFQKIGKHAGGSMSALQGARLEQPPHRLGRVPMLGDDGFERSLFAERGRVFGANRIEVPLGVVFLRALAFER